MQIYYSATGRGFYDSRIHGTRTIEIADPAWHRPLISIKLQPREGLEDGSQINTTEEPIFVDVPDEAAEHPLINVPNPDCMLPVDAVEITPERHAELLAGNAQGQLIVADENGQPTLQAPPPPTAEQLMAQATTKRTQLLQTATLAITPLQDAVDVGMATEAEQARLNTWKVYRVLLSRIEQQEGYPQNIEWPADPTDAT